MKKQIFIVLKISLITSLCLVAFSCNEKKGVSVKKPVSIPDTSKLLALREKIVKLLPPDRTRMGRVSFLDETFRDWIDRTNELPPDFDTLPSIPFLPDPLILDEGGKNEPVTSRSQWEEKRKWMKEQLEYYITGSYPPKPENLKAGILSEKKDGETTLRMICLTFGPDYRANLTVELMIPPGEGPFPVFLTQWNHREWAQVAVRRGYVGCVYAGADAKDDTEEYSEIWAKEYDFSRLMRRAFGAFRTVDYLYTLPFIDREKIAMTGHSRNGKLSLIAAAFDERIKAVIPSSGGTGAEVPWRYCAQKYDVEDLALLTCAQPSWFHPRLRFFVGRENKLPVDQNLFMALIAPRGLMLSTAINEGASNPWGIEQAYFSARKVYQFLGAEDNLAIRNRYGLHSVSARDMEDYIDFFDYVFERSDHKPENRLLYNYSFESWRELSGERIDPMSYPVKDMDDLTVDEEGNSIRSMADWKDKKEEILQRLQWVLGDEPPGVTNPGPQVFNPHERDENSFGTFLIRPEPTPRMGRMAVSPYSGFGDNLFGYLYYPADAEGNLKKESLPVMIYLHEYDYSKGFNSYHQIDSFIETLVDSGYAVFTYDMLGFGNRIEEGTRFYDRYPHWSKMGKMVVDVKGALDALIHLDFVDTTKIFVTGYALGATVGLYAAALDERIAGVVSVGGFTPMRLNTPEKGTEGIRAYSHLHGLIPRLGFFVGHEDRIPVDFNEILACIAPRPVLAIAPAMDQDAHLEDIVYCVERASDIYRLYEATDSILLFSPDDYNRFSEDMRVKTYAWVTEQLRK